MWHVLFIDLFFAICWSFCSLCSLPRLKPRKAHCTIIHHLFTYQFWYFLKIYIIFIWSTLVPVFFLTVILWDWNAVCIQKKVNKYWNKSNICNLLSLQTKLTVIRAYCYSLHSETEKLLLKSKQRQLFLSRGDVLSHVATQSGTNKGDVAMDIWASESVVISFASQRPWSKQSSRFD